MPSEDDVSLTLHEKTNPGEGTDINGIVAKKTTDQDSGQHVAEDDGHKVDTQNSVEAADEEAEKNGFLPDSEMPPTDENSVDCELYSNGDVRNEKLGKDEEESSSVTEGNGSKDEKSQKYEPSDEDSAGLSDAPVVSGIESSDNLTMEEAQESNEEDLEDASLENSASQEDSDATDESIAGSSQKGIVENLVPLKEAELSSFVSVLKRFNKRMMDASSGRKHQQLRIAWKSTLERATAHSDCADLTRIADELLNVLKEGCESQNVSIVDCCLDLVLRLFEYQYLGTGEDVGSGVVVLDAVQGRLDEIVLLVCGCLEVKEEEVYLRMVQTLLTAASTTKIGLHAGTLLAAVRTIYNIFLNARTRETRTTARVSLTQILNLVFARMEGESAEDDSKSFDAVGDTAENDIGEQATKAESLDESFSSILQKDAYLLFRALCKLSSKPIADDALSDSVPSRSKLLSLQLLHNILASSGPTFRSGTRFIYALRSYLAPSLLQNALSNHMPTVSVALDTMELLIVRESLRAVLKDELGAMIPATLFRFVSSSQSGERRAKALSVLTSVATDGQTLADIFLNYDCGYGAPSLFKSLMEVLASTAEGESVRPENRMKSLATVVAVLKSLRVWIDSKQDFGDANSVQDIEAVLEQKGRQGEGVRLFNAKPKKGVEYLVEKGSLKRNASDVAHWIASSQGLYKAMIGEYLGDGGGFNQEVLKFFVGSQNFKGLVFDEALRRFLVRFRLPGEAQKIDRFMQTFANRFCECNPDDFAGPDTAHVLAYSCIMLHTDAHNDSIKVKMTAEDFKRNNRKIDDGKNLDPAFLLGLYNRITTTEIKMDGDTPGDTAISQAAFEEESARLSEQIKADFVSRKKAIPQYEYITASDLQHARLMFAQAWPSVLSTLSIILERAPQGASKTISLCLSGFRQAIALTSSFGLSVQKNAFVSSLCRFTHLDSSSELYAKNLECIRMVLAIAAVEGDALGEQWRLIIHAISQVEHIRAVASDSPKKYALSRDLSFTNEKVARTQREKRRSVDSIPETREKEALPKTLSASNEISLTSSVVMNGTIPTGEKLQSQANSIANSIPEADTDRIFLSSKMLSPAGFTDFITALCAVSMSEVAAKSGPTVFCIQKLVETISYNCERSDNEAWSKSWAAVTEFFRQVLAMDVKALSVYAVDVARQLAQKWLDFDGIVTKNLQRAALRPFVPCFLESKGRRNVSVRELVLQSLLQITLSKGSDLNEGWRPILAVLTSAGSDKEEDIVVFGWQILERVARYDMTSQDDGLFLETASTLTAYAQNSSSPVIAVAAISHLCTKCPKMLADSLSEEEETFSADVDSHVGAWFRILTGVAAAASDDRPTVRGAAFEGLFAILMTYGGRFSPSLWHLILRGVLSPLLDEVNAAEDADTASRWVSSSGASILRSFVEVFARHRGTMRGILRDVTALLRKWITHDAELVAREGMTALSKLVKKCGADFCAKDWEILVKEVSSLFDLTMPYEILGPGHGKETLISDKRRKANENSDEAFRDSPSVVSDDGEGSRSRDRPKQKADIQIVRSKCVVQLLLIQMVQDIIVKFYTSLNTEHMSMLASCVERSYRFAREFNADVERRFSLWRTGFMNQVPNLLKQETTGVMTFLRILLWLYLDEKRDAPAVEEKLFMYCEDVKTAFVDASENARERPEEHREVSALFPVVVFILKGLMQMSEKQFQQHIEDIYDLLLDLMEASDVKEVRTVIRDLLSSRFAPRRSLGVDPEGQTKERFTPSPQIPGKEREVVLALEGVELHEEETAVKIQASIEKISGVSSAVINTEERIARVYTTAPDELLISALTIGGRVKGASVVRQANDIDVLD